MKLTYTIEPSEKYPGQMDLHTQMEDGGEALIDVMLTVDPTLVEKQIPCLSQTVLRWWCRVTNRPLPNDPNFRELHT